MTPGGEVDAGPGLARLVAEGDIRNLIARLAHLADDGDLQEYLGLFTEDGTWQHAETGDRRAGHAELLAGAQERRRDGIQGPGTGTRHILTTTWVVIDGEADARAESYYLYLGTDGPAGPVIRKTGRYRDAFRRTPQGWRIAARTVVEDVN